MKHLEHLFNYVLENYKNNHKNAERSDPIYPVVCDEIPLLLKSFIFPLRKDLLVTGSCGVGQKTDFPWVAIFNTNITRSATKGIYIAYLFKKDLSGFYLALNQGITYFAKTYRRAKYDCAQKVATYFKNEIEDTYFAKDRINLGGHKGTLGFGYQETTILAKLYHANSFTSNEIESDLRKMMAIYDELSGVLAEDNYDYDRAIDKILFDYDKSFTPATEAIEEIKKEISSPIDVDIVRKLQYAEPVSKATKKYSKLRNNDVVKKTDYVQKAKTDAEIGELGEKLALEHEVERLTLAGRQDLAALVRRVSIKSDAFGYDIESFDWIGLKYRKIYIEVKTTVNKLDVDFQVSKKEVDTSTEKKDSYCLFRIYDVKNVNPKFYKVFGKLEEHFELNPITFMAHYR
ncbi:MAG: DUF3578 domain-containing protein [Bacilli bacterium]|jgi:hypothetical protein|nr:DUF3578 domain-containing protein [Bacilli bacterium]MDD3388822.1 DUF3578 domain-containing protein [Bacilli bacterium]MDD4345260.1 DUF3578 domain-containing protein [Bacilli bacterium]MDD4521317.1 DUF3578 domain-containing protein [Bacilli bacterium]MDY0399079.1 DUF3578 domain-containing protein [Bacilli bacterium]